MRIAIVTTSWPADTGDPSGHFVRTEARELERAGHEVVIIAPRPGGAFGWPGVAARLRERPARAIDATRWVAHARGRVQGLAAERIVAHWAVPCAWPIAMADGDAPLDVVSHGGDVRLLTAVPRVVRDRVASAIAGRARSWRFVSEALRADLLGALGPATRARVEGIALVRPAAIDFPDVRHLRETAALLREELGARRAAVSVGRLVTSKRVDRTIEHVARSRAAEVLVVVGDGPERRRLEQLARALGVDARFVGLVERERALAWIAAADFVVHASEAEGLSTVLREAEALGVPVVSV
jgi:glycosyltransferase involved in cell wall biosynthesis